MKLNKEFELRQKQVLEVLKILAREAAAQRETLVFIGGSAVQTAVLKEPKRLSVDLDLYYSGKNPDTLFSKLEGYNIQKRQTKNAELFSFFNITRGEIQVKIDIALFSLADKGVAFEPIGVKIEREKFKVNVAKPSYLLAAKLSTLSRGTIGRKTTSPMDFLKDVFDADSLIEEFGTSGETWSYFEQICSIQNKMRKTNFVLSEIIDNAINELLNSALTDDSKAVVKRADLGNFNQSYLLGGKQVTKKEYWTMANRLAAYLALFKELGEAAGKAIEEMEAAVKEKYADKKFIEECEKKLVEKNIDAKQLHELKVIAPKALTYLYVAKYPKKFAVSLNDGLKDGLGKGLKDGLN